MGNKLKLPATIRLAQEEEPRKHQPQSVKNLHEYHVKCFDKKVVFTLSILI